MQRQESDEVEVVYEDDPVLTSVGLGDSVSELHGADGLRTAKLSQNSRSDPPVDPNISRREMTRRLRADDNEWRTRVPLMSGQVYRSHYDTVVKRFIELRLKPRCKRRRVESLSDKVDSHAAVTSAVSPDSSATTTSTTKVSMELTASQLMLQPSSTRITPHGRRFQPVKKGDETPKSFVEFHKETGGSTSSYHAYLQAFYEKSEAATIKCKLVTTDGITVEADKLKGLEELDVDDQQVAQGLVHSQSGLEATKGRSHTRLHE